MNGNIYMGKIYLSESTDDLTMVSERAVCAAMFPVDDRAMIPIFAQMNEPIGTSIPLTRSNFDDCDTRD